MSLHKKNLATDMGFPSSERRCGDRAGGQLASSPVKGEMSQRESMGKLKRNTDPGAPAAAQWVKNLTAGVPTVARQVTNPTSIHDDTVSIPGLAQCIVLS